MLPHLFGRPVSLVRCPTGKPQDCFFQRHAFTGMPPTVATLRDRRTRTRRPRPTSRSRTPRAIWRWRSSAWSSSTPGAACASGSRSRTGSSSTSIPGEGIAWREVVEAAVHVRGELRGAGARAVRQDHRAARASMWWCRSRRSSTGSRCIAATGEIAARHRRARRRTPSPPSWARRTASGASSSTSTATRAAPPRSAPYSLRARNNLPASAPLSWEDLEIDRRSGGFELFFAAGTGGRLRRSLGRDRRFRPGFAGTDRRAGRSAVRRVGDEHGAEGKLEGLSQAEPGELPGAALSGDQRERAHQLQPAAQGHPQPDQHEAGRSRARAGRAVGPGQGLRVRGQEVHHHRGQRPRGGAASSPTTR